MIIFTLDLTTNVAVVSTLRSSLSTTSCLNNNLITQCLPSITHLRDAINQILITSKQLLGFPFFLMTKLSDLPQLHKTVNIDIISNNGTFESRPDVRVFRNARPVTTTETARLLDRPT